MNKLTPHQKRINKIYLDAAYYIHKIRVSSKLTDEQKETYIKQYLDETRVNLYEINYEAKK